MADYLLFGPHYAGKTQLVYSLRGEEYTNPQQTGEEEYSVKKGTFWGVFGLSKYSVHEIGGKEKYYFNKEFLANAFNADQNVVFVFNGNDFINELRNYEEGGLISTILRCYVMPALKESERNNSVQFIATFEDEYCGEKPDMHSEIISCIEKANAEYLQVVSAQRYPFKTLIHGNLYCVDARNKNRVRELFKQIEKA
jgi:hypothetical protein